MLIWSHCSSCSEWKFGLAKLIRNMQRTFVAPTPLNLFTTWMVLIRFLAFHPLFGPWAIIIGECLLDVGKFVVVLSLFVFGYAMLGSSMNQPFGLPTDFIDDPELNPDNLTQAELFEQKSSEENNHPFYMFEVHFFALFGITSHEDVMDSKYIMGD